MIRIPMIFAFFAFLALLATGAVSAQMLCPDGTYVSGERQTHRCKLAPDGSYVSEPLYVSEPRQSGSSGNVLTGLGEALQRRAEQDRQDRLIAEERAREDARFEQQMRLLEQELAASRPSPESAGVVSHAELPPLVCTNELLSTPDGRVTSSSGKFLVTIEQSAFGDVTLRRSDSSEPFVAMISNGEVKAIAEYERDDAPVADTLHINRFTGKFESIHDLDGNGLLYFGSSVAAEPLF